MDNDEIQYRNMSTPASFGVEWKANNGTHSHQLVNIRGTTSLDYGIKAPATREWSTTRVVDPERFGLTQPPKDYTEFMTVVRQFAED